MRWLALALLLLTTACGLRPMYAGGPHGVTASALSQVEVAPIPGKAGWLLRNALVDRLGGESQSPRFRLVVTLDDTVQGFGVRADNRITRERRTLRARYRLLDIADGSVLLDATAGLDAGIDVVSSEYATIAAENSALENLTRNVAAQIVTRIATLARPAG